MATENASPAPASPAPARISPLHRIAHVLVAAGTVATTIGARMLQEHNEAMVSEIEAARGEVRKLTASVNFHRDRADRMTEAAAALGGPAYVKGFQAPGDVDEHQAAGNP